MLETIAEEQRRADRLRRTVDVTCAWLRQARPQRHEAEAVVAFTKQRVLELFPDKDHVWSLVLAPRFARILDEFCGRGSAETGPRNPGAAAAD